MLIDDRHDLLIDKASYRVPNKQFFVREKVINTVEIDSSKRHSKKGIIAE